MKNLTGVKRCNDGINKIEKKKNQRDNFRMFLGFKKIYIFQTKEQSVLSKIQAVFSTEEIILQHSVFGYYVDFYLLEHKSRSSK